MWVSLIFLKNYFIAVELINIKTALFILAISLSGIITIGKII